MLAMTHGKGVRVALVDSTSLSSGELLLIPQSYPMSSFDQPLSPHCGGDYKS